MADKDPSNTTRTMKRVFRLIFVFIPFLWISCATSEQKIEYGAHDGKYLTILGSKIYYEEYGQGTPLILLQGGGITRSIGDFKKCIPELSKHFKVIIPDTPGQGRSEQADSMSYQLLTEYTSILIDTLKIDSAYVMGWSDGGIIGLLLAEKRPEKIIKVVSVGANNGLRGVIPPGVDINLVKPYPMDEFEKNNKEVIEKYKKTLPRDWKKLWNDLNKMWYQEEYFSKALYNRINVPVMIVLGDRDDIPTEHGLEMHKLIKGSQFCVLPNTSHEVFAERPDLINQIAIDFFK